MPAIVPLTGGVWAPSPRTFTGADGREITETGTVFRNLAFKNKCEERDMKGSKIECLHCGHIWITKPVMHANKHGINRGRSRPRQCANRQCLVYLQREGKDFRFLQSDDVFTDPIIKASHTQRATKRPHRPVTIEQVIDSIAMSDLNPRGRVASTSGNEEDEDEWTLDEENAARQMIGLRTLTRKKWEKQRKRERIWRENKETD